MKTRLAILFLVIAGLLAGCATADKLNDLRIGMSQDQVIALMGKPDSKSAQANIEYFTYFLSNDSSRYGNQPYLVRLVEGKVESFGRFTQLFDIYNRPVGEGVPPANLGYPAVLGMAGYPTSSATAPATDLATQIQKLKTLKDQGVLTDNEFQAAKQKLLGSPK